MSDMSRGKKWLFSFGTKSLEQKSNMLTWSADAGAFNLFVHSADLDMLVKREFRLFFVAQWEEDNALFPQTKRGFVG